MDDHSPGAPEELAPREPVAGDLAAICRKLNTLGARYLVCGGFAMLAAGYPCNTGHIELLIDASLENEAKVFRALEALPDRAVRELRPGDVAEYTVVRVADEVIVDLMQSASGIDYAKGAASVVFREVDGVPVPFAAPELLWRMKRHTHREKDAGDLVFLRELFAAHGMAPPAD